MSEPGPVDPQEPAPEPAAEPDRPSPASGAPALDERRPTRISAAWVATGVVLVLLILLLVFILQNGQRVRIHFLGWSPVMPVGVAMLLSAVVGGVVVGVAGTLRVVQVRRHARRTQR